VKQDIAKSGDRKTLQRPERYPEPTDEGERRKDLGLYFTTVYWARRVGAAPRTRDLYEITLRHFNKFLARRATLDDLADETTLAAYLQQRLTNVVAPTAAKCRCNLMAMANFAFKKGHIPTCPEVQPIVIPEITPEAWTLDELRRLLDACRVMPGKMDGLPSGDWWYALHLFALDTGERTEATLSLRWSWVDRLHGWVNVPAMVRKGRRKPMRYKLRSETLAALVSLSRPNREHVFWTPAVTSTATFYGRYDQLLSRAGLPKGRRFKLQRMRRTFASLVERSGGDATRALAHSSRRITERSYLDESLIDRPPIVTFIERAIGKALRVQPMVIEIADTADNLDLPVAELVA